MTSFQSLSSGSLRSQGSSGSGDVTEEIILGCTDGVCEKATTYGLNKCFKMDEEKAKISHLI